MKEAHADGKLDSRHANKRTRALRCGCVMNSQSKSFINNGLLFLLQNISNNWILITKI